jgi:hypothetical protein
VQEQETKSATEHLESRVTRLEEGQIQLLAGMARVESMVESLAGGQKGVFERINRPWQWGAVVAAFVAILSLAGIFGTILNLSLSPIADHIQDVREHDRVTERRVNDLEFKSAYFERDHYWLEKEVDRNGSDIGDLIERIRILHTPGFLHNHGTKNEYRPD